MKRYGLLLLSLFFLIYSKAQEQSLLSSSGGYLQTNGYTISWSLGETITETFGVGEYTFTQGFQQSKLDPVSIIDSKTSLTSAIDVFPNPTQGLVHIKLNKELPNKNNNTYNFTLYNIKGKQLLKGNFQEDQLTIDLTQYLGSVYCLRLYNLDTNDQSTVIIQKIKY